jgi:nicotinamide-nucleotide amidase
MAKSAAIVTVGSELVEGLRIDTNTAEIARDVSRYGFAVRETVSVGDETAILAETLRRLAETTELVVVTGGLGPTHDDITRDAAAAALGVEMHEDAELKALLAPVIARHADERSHAQVLTQALVLDGADAIAPTTGTAAGQVIPTPAGTLVLLPGPPREMRPMLATVMSRFPVARAEARELGVTGLPESDVQHAAQTALARFTGIQLTVLAKPGDVRVILLDSRAGETTLAEAAEAVAHEIGPACYSTDGASLAETLVREARARRVTLATAESCTGGMVAAAITDVAGASEVFLGGVVSYSNEAKVHLLGVEQRDLDANGAVSREVAEAMACGARERFRADVSVAVTGIAGPGGGSLEKPVGTVWFALCARGTPIESRMTSAWAGASRAAIRDRATAAALDMLRREVLKR